MEELVHGADLGDLPAAAEFHHVVGFVYHSLGQGSLLREDVAEPLRAAYHKAVLGHAQALADLRELASVLDSLGVPWLVIKGPVLAEAVYPRPDLRGYRDLDLVVASSCFGQVLDAFEEAGGHVIDRNWDILRHRMEAEMMVVARHGTPVDLHWHILNEARHRLAFDIPMGELFERSRKVDLAGRKVPALDPVDSLIHLAVHGCMSGAHKLVWLKDIDESMRGNSLSWAALVERCRTFGVGFVVASMLEMTHTVLGTPLPDSILDELAASRAWRGLLTGVEWIWPVEQARGRSPVRTLARSTRRDTRTTAVQLHHNVAAALGRPFWKPAPMYDEDDSDPTSYFHGAGSRAEYLAAVESSHSERSP